MCYCVMTSSYDLCVFQFSNLKSQCVTIDIMSLQILYHIAHELGFDGTQAAFKTCGKYLQEWCPAHRMEKVEYYAGREQVTKTVRS